MTFRIDELQNRYNMSTDEIEDLLNEDEFWEEMAEIADEVHAESLAEKKMERAEEIRDERREDGINDRKEKENASKIQR